MSFGLDYVTGPPIADLKAAEVTFVCRYLSEVNALTKIKLLTPEEVKLLGENGIALVSNYEWYANRSLEGAVSGVQDAQIARDQHAACGGPAGRPIYFSVDFDATAAEMPAIIDYFKGVSSVLGLARTGAYGSYSVIRALFDAKAITWGWQTYAWSAGAWEPRVHIQQYANSVTLAGASVDYNRSMKADFGQWLAQGGSTPVPTTTPGGENAVFIDDIDQLEPGETEDACVAFAAANVFYSTQPGTTNLHKAEEVDQLADKWYVKDTGSITSSAGLSEKQLQDMLTSMGLVWETIPITSSGPANDEAVRIALRAGKLVIVCAAEDSFFDLEIGRPPYSWNTKPFNHCIVASGLITSGSWQGNVWVRDTVAVSGGYPPSTKRPYDLGKMQYVSLTAVVPSWLKGETMLDISAVLNYFTDQGNDVWKCKQTGCLLGHGMLGLFRSTPTPLALIGLPRTNEIPVPGHPGVVIMICERMILIYDPNHEIDSPPGAGEVYAMHIDQVQSLGLTQLLTLLGISNQTPPLAQPNATAIADLQVLRSSTDAALAKILTDLGASA